MATKIKKTEAAGSAAGLQLFGVVLIVVGFFLSTLGLVFFGGLGLIMLVYGGIKANVQVCSECRAKVEKEAKICPPCRSNFS